MALTNLSQITTSGISTLADVSLNSITGVDATFTGNVSIGGTLTYDDVTNIDSVGLITARSGVRVLTGTATTALVVEGNARVTGILTVGSSSLTLDGTNNVVNVGTALTLGHTQGLQFHTQNLHSQGFDVNNINATGIITATSGLHVTGGNVILGTNATYANDTANDLQIGQTSSSNSGITIGSSSQGQVAFADAGANRAGLINYNHGSDAMIFYTNGPSNERLRITSTGNIGINETTPEAKLEVDGRIRVLDNNDATPSTGKGLEISYFNTADYADILSYDRGGSAYKDLYLRGNNLVFKTGTSERLRISSGGKLLAGHTASRDVFRETRVQISGDNGDDAGLSIYSTEDGIAGPNLILGHSRNGAAVNSEDVLGDITFVGHDSTDLNSRASIIRSIMTANGTNNSLYADLVFYTKRNSGGYPDESLRIASDGNLTLGNASYGSGLGQLRIINDASSAPASLALFGHNNTNDGDPFGQIQFAEQESGTAGQVKAKIEAQAVSTNERGADLVLFTAANSASSTPSERLRITSDGKVFIGSSVEYANSKAISDKGVVVTSDGENTLKLLDSTSYAPNVGASILLGGNYRASGDTQPFVRLKSFKENSTNGNYSYGFSISTNPNNGSITERLRITSAGKVGIGTDDPKQFLSVVGRATFDQAGDYYGAWINGNSTADSSFNVGAWYNIGGRLRDNGNHVVLESMNTSHYVQLQPSGGNVGIASATPAARLDVYKDFNGLGAGEYAGRVYGEDAGVSETGVRFVTKGTGDLHNAANAYLMHGISNGTTRFVFGANGKVGINANNPSYHLDVNGSIRSRATGAGTGLLLHSNCGLTANSNLMQIWSGQNNGMSFHTNSTGDGSNERLRVRTDGHVASGGSLVASANYGDVTNFHNNKEGCGMYRNNAYSSCGAHIAVGADATDGWSNMYLNRFWSSGEDERMVDFRLSNTTKGTITANSSGVTYNTTSDIRLKTDINPISDATDKLMNMNPVTHKWKEDPDGDTVHGFIAQEMQNIAPEAVHGEPDGEMMMGMDYGRITPIIVAALQDAIEEINTLKQKISELEN